MSIMTGRVSIVGAGPGDPGLLTRKAVARLRVADLVLYDALVDVRVLKFARRAQRFFVGKRAGTNRRGGSRGLNEVSQQAIHALMIRAARRGRRVVRLKGGDPFVFGRGGEEAQALRAAGVPFEIVPGVSSALAAPALAGIPLTHRGTASAFLVVTGHDADALSSVIQNANKATLVVLMGLGRSAALACDLIDRGWPRGTPAAVIFEASTPRQQTWRGRLDDLASDGLQIDSDGPATIVIGDVAALELAGEARQVAHPQETINVSRR